MDNKGTKSKNIRIAYFVPGLISGGVEQMLINYCSYMDKNKLLFDVIYQHEPVEVCLQKIEKAGCHTYRIPSKAHHPIKNFIFTYKIIKKGKYGIVHSHMNLMNFIPLFFAKVCGVKVRISHSHISEKNKSFLYTCFANICKILTKMFATDFFACGEEAAMYMYGKKMLSNKKVSIVNNAIDINKFQFNKKVRKEIRGRLNIEDKLVIGHIGRFTEQKNHHKLIEIFKEINQIEKQSVLLLIGTGELENQIRRKVLDLNLENSVLFLGARSDINELYQAMDIFLLPSLFEGLPVVSIEAQAAGLRCFFSDTVDEAAKMTDLVKFIPLTLSPKEWSRKILIASKNENRKNTQNDIQKAGYDIKIEAKKLEQKYINYFNSN